MFILAIGMSFEGHHQVLSGNLKEHKGQVITLTGFDYYQTYELAKDTIDQLGDFSLDYPKDYRGMGLIRTQDNSSLLVALTEPNIHLEGPHLRELDSLQFLKGVKNQEFVHIVRGYSQRSQVSRAWNYLYEKYKNQAPLNNQERVFKWIQKELKRIKIEDAKAIHHLPDSSYIKWFIPIRKFISDEPQTTSNYSERIAQNIEYFRNLDFSHSNFKTSSFFRDLLEGHYFLLENMGQSLDSAYVQMNLSTDYLIDNLKNKNNLLNNVSEELFILFEKRSLFKAAAYLSEKLLNTKYNVVLDGGLKKRLQKYGALMVGNTAPDIQLTATQKMSDLNQIVLLVFGSSQCSYCTKDLLDLEELHSDLKSNKVTVVYISMDTDKTEFESLYNHKPWKTFCDFKGWDTQAAKDYYVNATPTYVLIDQNLKILLHPKSVSHVLAWVKGRF